MEDSDIGVYAFTPEGIVEVTDLNDLATSGRFAVTGVHDFTKGDDRVFPPCVGLEFILSGRLFRYLIPATTAEMVYQALNMIIGDGSIDANV